MVRKTTSLFLVWDPAKDTRPTCGALRREDRTGSPKEPREIWGKKTSKLRVLSRTLKTLTKNYRRPRQLSCLTCLPYKWTLYTHTSKRTIRTCTMSSYDLWASGSASGFLKKRSWLRTHRLKENWTGFSRRKSRGKNLLRNTSTSTRPTWRSTEFLMFLSSFQSFIPRKAFKCKTAAIEDWYKWWGSLLTSSIRMFAMESLFFTWLNWSRTDQSFKSSWTSPLY